MRPTIKKIAFFVAAACAVAPAAADESVFTETARVAETALDGVRGGFEIPENLHASLRLQRAAYVNGDLVASLDVDIPDIGNMTPEQAKALAHASGTLVIQNGAANTYNAMDLGPASTVIQNTLNDQSVMALTTISVEVNSLGALRELNFHDSLGGALGSIAGVR